MKADDAKFTNLEVSGDANLGDVLKVDQVAGRVGFGTTNPEIDLQVINTVTGAGISIGTLVATTSSQLTLENPKSEIQIRFKKMVFRVYLLRNHEAQHQ